MYLVATDDGLVHQVNGAAAMCGFRAPRAGVSRAMLVPAGMMHPAMPCMHAAKHADCGRVSFHGSSTAAVRLAQSAAMRQLVAVLCSSAVTPWCAPQSNTSYADQVMRTFRGHLGPVYRVAWSPFAPEHFMTASADWTAKLWSDKQVQIAAAAFLAGWESRVQLPRGQLRTSEAMFTSLDRLASCSQAQLLALHAVAAQADFCLTGAGSNELGQLCQACKRDVACVRAEHGAADLPERDCGCHGRGLVSAQRHCLWLRHCSRCSLLCC